MAVEDIFKRQKKIYLFYTLLPILLFFEIFIYVYTDSFRTGVQILPFLFGIVLILESIIIPIQLVSRRYFLKQISEMSKNEKNTFRDRPLLIGPILVNESFIIEYRMLKKRVIPIRDIFQAKYKYEKSDRSAGMIRVSFSLKKIVLLREGKKQIVIKSPSLFFGQEPLVIVNSINKVIQGGKIREEIKDIYEEYDGDYPFFGMFFWVLFGLVFLLQRICTPFMNLFINTEDQIEYFLFHVGFDRYFQIGEFVIICLYVILCFIWKYKYMGINFDSILSNFISCVLVLVLLLMEIFLVDYGDISSEARKDYLNYKKENFEYIETYLIDGDDYFFRENNDALEKLPEEIQLKIRTYVGKEQNLDFLSFSDYSNILKGKKYGIKYLNNTGLILTIQEIQN